MRPHVDLSGSVQYLGNQLNMSLRTHAQAILWKKRSNSCSEIRTRVLDDAECEGDAYFFFLLFFLFFFWSSGGWVKRKLKLPPFHVSDTYMLCFDLTHAPVAYRAIRVGVNNRPITRPRAIHTSDVSSIPTWWPRFSRQGRCIPDLHHYLAHDARGKPCNTYDLYIHVSGLDLYCAHPAQSLTTARESS